MTGRMGVMGLVLAVGMGGIAKAQEDRAERLKELHEKVAALEARQIAASRDLAATIDAVLRDAEQRSTLLSNVSAMTAGYDDGFFIKSGAFECRPAITAQFRNVSTWMEDADGSGGSGWENGFVWRRVEVEFQGTIFSRNLYYDLILKTPSDGRPIVDEAFIVYSFEGTPWSIKGGQYKDFVYHEESTSSKRQLAVERSLLNDVLAGGCFDRVQGVALTYAQDALRIEVATHDGAASANTTFEDSPGERAALEHFGVSGRAEWLAMGDWKAYKDFSARDTKEDLLVVGLGADWTQGDYADGLADAVGGDRILSALDAQWELAGPKIGLFGALVADYTSFNDSAAGDDRLNWGVLAQAGWAIDHEWEVFARYDLIHMDDDFRPEGMNDNYHEITVGVNRFLGPNGSAGHRAKITVDFGYLPNGSPARSGGVGIPRATDDDVLYVRAQLQLVI